MKKLILIIFLLLTKLTEGQIINGGFEVWDTIGGCSYCSDLMNLFGVLNPEGGIANHWMNGSGNSNGVKRTTDSNSGSYSILLHNWYGQPHGWITYHDSISFKPQFLQGYFKYISNAIDGLSQGTARVTLTRFNGISNDTIAVGTYQFDSTTSFTPFQITLDYFSMLNPDSIKIFLINAEDGCLQNPVCDLLYLDNLVLSNTPLGISAVNSNADLVLVFPNPISNELTIQNNSTQQFQFTLYNSIGEKLIDKILTAKTSMINLSAYANDIYFYKLSNDAQEFKNGKIIKQ